MRIINLCRRAWRCFMTRPDRRAGRLPTETSCALTNRACLDVISNWRVSPRILQCNWIDAMAMLRGRRVVDLGGYDGQWLCGLEDWELNQRLFLLGEPMVFVPVLVGRYSTLPGSMLREAPTALGTAGPRSMFGSAAADRAEDRAGLHHPRVGILWSSPGWSGPARCIEPMQSSHAEPLKILVISSGGVRNYGDDAICSRPPAPGAHPAGLASGRGI